MIILRENHNQYMYIKYIDSKAKLSIIFIICPDKIYNLVMMLGVEGNENGEKTTIGLISKKATLHVQPTLFDTILCLYFSRLQRETSGGFDCEIEREIRKRISPPRNPSSGRISIKKSKSGIFGFPFYRSIE